MDDTYILNDTFKVVSSSEAAMRNPDSHKCRIWLLECVLVIPHHPATQFLQPECIRAAEGAIQPLRGERSILISFALQRSLAGCGRVLHREWCALAATSVRYYG